MRLLEGVKQTKTLPDSISTGETRVSMTGTPRPGEIDGIMNVQELIDLLEDCDPEAFGSRTC